MHLRVTVGAAAIEKENGIAPARIRRMTSACHVALSAEPRVGHFQQAVVDRAMGLVTVGAVFKHRRMLMQKWPAPFGVAGITVFIDAGLLELSGIGCAVRIVAIRASEFPLA